MLYVFKNLTPETSIVFKESKLKKDKIVITSNVEISIEFRAKVNGKTQTFQTKIIKPGKHWFKIPFYKKPKSDSSNFSFKYVK